MWRMETTVSPWLTLFLFEALSAELRDVENVFSRGNNRVFSFALSVTDETVRSLHVRWINFCCNVLSKKISLFSYINNVE